MLAQTLNCSKWTVWPVNLSLQIPPLYFFGLTTWRFHSFFFPDLFKVSVHHWWILSAATTAKHGLLKARYVWLTVLSFCASFNACWPPQGVILFYSFFLVMATLQLPATNLANLANLPPGTKLYLTTNSKNPSGKGKLLLIPQGAILRATNNAS